jgi:hypothetical protein
MDLQLIAKKYGSVRKMAKAFGPYTQDRATKERSQFVSKVKEVWLKNDSPFALANNVIFTDVNKQTKIGVMTVTPALVESGVATVDELRKLLMSSEMYRNPVLYDLFCGGVESGKIKYNEKRAPTTISKLLTMSHEANIRNEIWWALEKQNFHHNPSTTHIQDRKDQWLKCCDYVFKDRADNEEQATKERRGDCPLQHEESGDDDDDEEDELDKKYY